MNKTLLLLLLMAGCAASAQNAHWKAMPFNYNDQQAYFSLDSGGDAMYIAGMFDHVDGVKCRVIKWDGQNYTLLPVPRATNMRPPVRFKGKLYMSGNLGLERLDDTGWTVICGRSPSVIKIWDDKLMAIGPEKTCTPYIGDLALFDGTTWTDFLHFDTVLKNEGWGVIDAVRYKGQVYVCGNLNPYTHPEITEIARFDGQHWTGVGGGIRGNGLAGAGQLLVWHDELYVCGEFFERDGSPGNCIAKWDGTNWHRLGDGLLAGPYEASVQQMTIYNDNLYVIGGFRTAGDIPAAGIARWDGQKWCSIDNTISDGGGLAIQAFKGDFYIGGGFVAIGGDSSQHWISHWIGGNYADSCGKPLSVAGLEMGKSAISVQPNPSTGLFHVDYINSSGTATSGRVVVCNIMGQVVRSRIINLTYGQNEFSLDLHELPAGTYLLQINAGGTIESAKLSKY